MNAGQCHCGKIQFRFEGAPSDVSICHCSVCRRLTGSAFAAYCGVPDERFSVTSGSDHLTTYRPTDRLEKQFCRTCGVVVVTRHSDFPGQTYISLGILADDSGISPEYHQFAGSKASWYDFEDSLPKFEEWPSG